MESHKTPVNSGGDTFASDSLQVAGVDAADGDDSFISKPRKCLRGREAGDGLTGQLTVVLQQRLLAAFLVLACAGSAFTVRDFVFGDLDSVTEHIAAGLLLALWAAVGWLYVRRPVCPIRLRTAETIVFLTVATASGLQLHSRLEQAAAIGDELNFVLAIKGHVIGAVFLMLMYTIFVPVTWRRAVVMIPLMALIPTLVLAACRLTHPEIDDIARHLASIDRISENVLLLVVGAAVSIYGTIVINNLRQRALTAENIGRYQLKEKLGAGGMGEVYLAEHQLLKRLCAVKLIRPDQADDPVMLARFEREVRATARLTHWNTVQVFDYGHTEDGTFFYVMEYLRGQNLKQLVEQFGPLSPSRVIAILTQVCDALSEAHDQRLVHRDIKPSNIFLSERGGHFDVAKLLDFGLVRPVSTTGDGDQTAVGQIKGSPRFMSPEQATGQQPDIRGDLYSLGAVAYFLLTGRPPFNDANPLRLVVAHATQPVPTFEEIGANVPEDLAAIVMRCLEKQPDQRFHDPRTLKRALLSCNDAGGWTDEMARQWWSVHPAVLTAADPESDSGRHENTSVDSPTESLEATLVGRDVPASFDA